ncbi:protein-tyrosine phosphatase-like protein [Blastocladiella britannica]|nr:protein-tyrosine phosphatase-like protein [Blastocladiella britannica]
MTPPATPTSPTSPDASSPTLPTAPSSLSMSASLMRPAQAAIALIRRPVSPVVNAASNMVAFAASVPSTIVSSAGAINANTCAFCGGRTCKYCGPARAELFPPTQIVLPGLYSSWITPNILAMARPSADLMANGNLVEEMRVRGVTSVINLQQLHEHPQCGYGVMPKTGFSYDPEEFIKAGFYFFNFSWEDMNVPTLEQILSIVKVMASQILAGRGVAVHCHAGLGRTGLAIACYLVYNEGMNATQAIALVRESRPGSVQTPKQVAFVTAFQVFFETLRSKVVLDPRYHGQSDLSEVMGAHRALFHGLESRYAVHWLIQDTLDQLGRLSKSLTSGDMVDQLQRVINGNGSAEDVEIRERLLANFTSTLRSPNISTCTSVPALLGILSTWFLSFLRDPAIKLTQDLQLPHGFAFDRAHSSPRAITVALFSCLHPY